MEEITHEGGSIHANDDRDNCASVEYVTLTQTDATHAEWRVYLRGVPMKANYTRRQRLTYNAKGTSNPNADNDLVVKSVLGPGAYLCDGPWPGRC